MLEILTQGIHKLNCLIDYIFLVYGALLAIFSFFSMGFAIGTAPAAFGLMFLHFLIQRFLLNVSKEVIIISLATDLGLIAIGLLPGVVLREQDISASLITLTLVTCVMIFWIYPSIASRCAIAL
ncbi:MAG: hypothetical protein AAGE59_25290 [Cyanobacteria bacterium P01_F01_bin.86]